MFSVYLSVGMAVFELDNAKFYSITILYCIK